MAKFMQADTSAFIDENESGRALHLIHTHRKGNTMRLPVLFIYPYGEAEPVLVHEYFQSIPAHDGVMLEDGVHPDDRHPFGIKFLIDSLRLGNADLYAARAKDLESMQDNHFATQFG